MASKKVPPLLLLCCGSILTSINLQKVPDDKWKLQKISTTFPRNAVRVVNEPNMYVALWPRKDAPIMGSAWNDCGVVQCAFAADKKVFKGSQIEGGSIQLLIYEGNHVTNQFYYDWLPLLKWEFIEGNGRRELVQSGEAVPIFWKEKKALGNYDLDKKTATFAIADKFEEITEKNELKNMLVLVRTINGGPPGCTCEQCSSDEHASKNPLMVNDWGDFCCGSLWPADK
ncbi:hypothetical protein OESDEN_24815 [Oesophagostomum dentatum]|uniref:Uncharacterized protein n=1 Tax=Oesophagostomum dentatum TaxID=61180 RepID=A0A0B1RSF1_OESDE|nr:hypothetical protein OESDEN_24815 [Oesophagostomum dentatum]